MKRLIEVIGSVGQSSFDIVREAGGVGMLLIDSAYWTFVAPFKGVYPDRAEVSKRLIDQGIASIPIVALLTGTVGLILGMNTAYYLEKLGAANLMPLLITFAMVRELGPLIASIIISGRVGAAIAAEIGTMVVAEEIDALRTMALNPTRFLVVPRIIALIIMLPCLGLLGTAAGIFGAFAYSTFKLNMAASEFQRLAFASLVPEDVWSGILKTVVFAVLITGIACYKGLNVRGGAEGVGQATTQTVVHSIFAIILADGLFTVIFTVFFP